MKRVVEQTTPANVERARLKVGLRRILQAMDDNPNGALAQENGCTAILELIPYSSDAEWRRVKSADGSEKQAHLRYTSL